MINITCKEKEQSNFERMKDGTAMDELDRVVHQPLRLVDIVAAIQYYGITELLDNIGESEIERYFGIK
jgi:hypothetical protein